MKIRYLLLLLLAVFSFRNSYAQEYLPQVKSRYYVSDSVTIWKPKPLRAAGEVIGTNLAVWAFDRFIVNESWARINGKTIRNNFRRGLMWDSDSVYHQFCFPILIMAGCILMPHAATD